MIYLDNQATTPCDPLVVAEMVPYFNQFYANAASGHEFGRYMADAVENSKKQISSLICCESDEIVFTSGATESNNIVLLGTCRKYKESAGMRRKLVTTPIEHKAVLAPLQQLVKEGWELIFLPIDRYGLIDLSKASDILDDGVFMVSVQLANSEIGTIQPVKEICQIAQQNGILVHCDAAQAIGKLPVDVNDLSIDFLSFSAHKIYGPKGIGAIWIREKLEHTISSIMHGGNSVKGIRPGTAPVPLIIGFGKACEITQKNFATDIAHSKHLRDLFERELRHEIEEIRVNGAVSSRLNNNSSLTFPDVDAEALLSNLPNIVASTSSACESGSIEPSRVLTAIGMSSDDAFQTIRFGFGRFNTEQEIKTATREIIITYHRLLDL